MCIGTEVQWGDLGLVQVTVLVRARRPAWTVSAVQGIGSEVSSPSAPVTVTAEPDAVGENTPW